MTLETMTREARPRIHINEVAMRDGLQIEPVFVPTSEKIDLVNDLSRTGVDKIEVTAFVSPKAVPALADAAQVLGGINRSNTVRYSALIPNLRGAQAAVDARVDEVNFVMSASEQHNMANVNMTHEQSIDLLAQVMHLVKTAGIDLNATIATSFGCSIEGVVPLALTMDIAERYARLGITSVTLADTVGMANPRQVAEMVRIFMAQFPDTRLTLHFHDTRGLGLANVLAAVQQGARSFDTALGGLGGCPFAPGATGNICTADTVHMLEAMGFDTGVDLAALTPIASRLAKALERDLPGRVLKAGPAYAPAARRE
ncbi:hydroxymethylglutaryl-CoA lyase [Roseiarcaceae bacterium H3SJ34-1]|uniref:hydroxymethylglutaryl-CoA lyase n=1 Tax=Terripilifer ovatus TaxID=3032367 RepID=UPI003AB93D53|nr:hydroxymethylglutaryl-CoA lyase [Roseiarcaceae bacterium H3SJ34-1]